jgi:hypothetical protein
MNPWKRHTVIAWPILGCLLFGAAAASSAQDDGANGPPKVLVIQREFLKPGKSGATHEKSEDAFVQAMLAAKSNSHYFALDSLSGPSRSLFFMGFPSVEAWEQDTRAIRKNTSLSAALDHAALMDGELLSGYDSSVLLRRDDMSNKPGNLLNMRYISIARYSVRPGHMHDWEELVKLYRDGFSSSVPEAKWAVFQMLYGVDEGSVFLVLTPMKSLAEADHSEGNAKFAAATGPAGMKHIAELSAACLMTAQTNLFEINPKMSYPPDSWIKAEPGFWTPVTTTSTRQTTDNSVVVAKQSNP